MRLPMIKHVAMMLTLIAAAALAAPAQETAKPKQDEHTPSVTPLRVQVVLTEFDGEKKISSLPYTFTVNADERRARPGSLIRTGARIPVGAAKDQVTYMDIGTNLDCSATLQDDGRYKLQMTVDRKSIAQDTPAGGNPVIRQFQVDLNPVLKDGQTVESVASVDPLSGHVYHVSVTVNVIK
jgi:hypothetical protein